MAEDPPRKFGPIDDTGTKDVYPTGQDIAPFLARPVCEGIGRCGRGSLRGVFRGGRGYSHVPVSDILPFIRSPVSGDPSIGEC